MKAFIFLCPASLGWFLLISILLSGCASIPPPIYDPISDADFKGPNLTAVRMDTAAWKGIRIRWGGDIVEVENQRHETWIEVVEYPLRSSGRPSNSKASEGRFIARIPGFLDPAIYAQGRQITIVGTVDNTIQRSIGDYPYEFPVVAVDTYRLWDEQRETDIIYYYPDPFWNSYLWYHRFHPWFPSDYYRYR